MFADQIFGHSFSWLAGSRFIPLRQAERLRDKCLPADHNGEMAEQSIPITGLSCPTHLILLVRNALHSMGCSTSRRMTFDQWVYTTQTGKGVLREL